MELRYQSKWKTVDYIWLSQVYISCSLTQNYSNYRNSHLLSSRTSTYLSERLARLSKSCTMAFNLVLVPIEANMSSDDILELAHSMDPAVVKRVLALEGDFKCPCCWDKVANPRLLLPCGHHLCGFCIDWLNEKEMQAKRSNRGLRICPLCRSAISRKETVDYDSFKKVHSFVDILDQDILARSRRLWNGYFHDGIQHKRKPKFMIRISPDGRAEQQAVGKERHSRDNFTQKILLSTR